MCYWGLQSTHDEPVVYSALDLTIHCWLGLCTFCLEIPHTEPQQDKRSVGLLSIIVSVKIFAFMSVPVSIYVWRSWSCTVAACSATRHEGRAFFGDPARYINVILLTSRLCKFAVCLPAGGQKQEQPHRDNMLPSPPPPMHPPRSSLIPRLLFA